MSHVEVDFPSKPVSAALEPARHQLNFIVMWFLWICL